MDFFTLTSVALLLCLAAALYSSVGHGGASAYLAIMALFAVPAATMRPTALALNLLVAGFGAFRFLRAGEFNLRLFLSCAVAAVPFAYLGGSIHVPPDVYRPLLGVVLWCAALRLLWTPRVLAERKIAAPPLRIALPAGAALGLLAGLTGTGGGIFLSPLILLLGWETPRRTSGVAACFIFFNSAAGLAGNLNALGELPREMPIFLVAVGLGALIGVWLGVRRLPQSVLLQLLGIVLAVAGAKLILA